MNQEPVIIDGLYRIDKKIGGGGMSEVFLGCNIRLNKNVAVKRVSKHMGNSFDLLAEENILKKIDHPYIVRITDIIEDENYLYIIEDYVEGKTMQQIIDEQGHVSEETALPWFKDLCSILIYLHSQNPPIIYRDMKPGNIMIQKSGHPKLIDFGISREYKQDRKFDTSLYLSPGFAAPEQYRGLQTDARSDIYGLGMTIHYLVTGVSPTDVYEYQSAATLNGDVSEGLSMIIDKCVKPDPSDRYQTAQDLLDDLNNIEKLDSSWQKFVNKKKKRNIIPGILCIAGTALVLSGALVLFNNKTEEYNSLLSKAQKQADEKTAIQMLNEAEKLDPDNASAYILEASVYFNQANYQKVIDITESLEKKNDFDKRDYPDLYNLLGSSYFELQNYDKAEEIFSDLTGSDNELSIVSTIDYAAVLGRQGKIEQAEKLLNSVKDGTQEPYLSYLEAELASLKKEYKKAAEKYQSVISDRKDNNLSRKAVIALAEVYRDSSMLNSDDSEYIDSAETKEIELIEKSISNNKVNYGSYIYELLGQAYYQRGLKNGNNENDLKASISAFTTEIKLGVRKNYLYGNIYKIDNILKDYQSASSVLDEYEKAFPNDYLVNVYRAENEINIQFSKSSESEMDFSKVLSEYQKAKKKVTSSDNTEELQSLEEYIDQLKEKGWLNG